MLEIMTFAISDLHCFGQESSALCTPSKSPQCKFIAPLVPRYHHLVVLLRIEVEYQICDLF